MNKTSYLLIVSICLAVISTMSFTGCSNDSDSDVDPPTIDARHTNITFRVPSQGDVAFEHKTHADYYDNTCLVCHMHTDVRDDTIWSCSECHDNNDSDGLCVDDVWSHDCMSVQCLDCHSQETNNPTPDCADCHSSPPVSNFPPAASLVGMTGTLAVNQTVTGTYTYSDTEGDLEGASLFQWYLADDAIGTNTTAIAGETNITIQPLNANLGKYLIFEVTPVALTGTSPGGSARSAPSGPITLVPSNSAPTASNAAISGVPNNHFVLTASYNYNDVDGDPEGVSIYQWYVAFDAMKTNATAITGATALTYTPVAGEVGKYLFFEVTPVAQTGNPQGAPSESSAVGPVTDTSVVKLYGTINQFSEVDRYDLYLTAGAMVTIDVESKEAPGFKGPRDFFGNGDSNDNLVTNVFVFDSGGIVEGFKDCSPPGCPKAGCYPGCDAPNAFSGRSGKNPYMDINITATDNYFLAIGAAPLSSGDAWNGTNNGDSSIYDATVLSKDKYRITFTFN
jgi:hypothetical protein